MKLLLLMSSSLMLVLRQLALTYELIAHRYVMSLFTRIADTHQVALTTACTEKQLECN